ncbi:MAG: hypothetical protein GXN93_00695 [Candidatus Diapherotrites archaeon]|nr:hypothetical protein [Candidatus Diapherotrites archaeon]
MIIKAARAWWKNAGTLAVAGLATYAVAIAIASVAYMVIAPISREIAGSVGTTVLIITYLLLGAAITKNTSEEKQTSIEQIIGNVRQSWADIGIGVVFTMVPMIVGTLALVAAAVYSISTGTEWAADVGLIVFICAYLTTVLLSLAPYIAAQKGWETAVKEAHTIGRRKYITLFAVGIAFTVFYIIYVAILPTAAGLLFAAADAIAIMHIRNITYYEILDSVSTHE